VNGPISQRAVPLTVKAVVAVLLMKVPDAVPVYQFSSILNVLEAPVLTWIEATYCCPATAANRGVVTGSVAPVPPKPVIRSMPVTPTWRT
jgi:hypothetical protein